MATQQSFKPYIPADKIVPEMTFLSIFIGVILSVVFGAANAYLGLRVGMTVSASIPAAVISMGIIRMILHRDSILENSLVQTIGSAGESLAAGAIFTLPAMYLWAQEGIMEKPSYLEITSIGIIGGLLGVFFMVPLRNALIVKQHGVLPYPEGTACAQVLLAGEKGGASASLVFKGLGISAIFKLVIDGMRVVPGEITTSLKGVGNYFGAMGTQIYPAVLSVGYICGLKISAVIFAGGTIAWLVIMPLMVLFGGDTVVEPHNISVMQMFTDGDLYSIWSGYIRYVGAGALVCAGLMSLLRTLPMIVSTIVDSIRDIKDSSKVVSVDRTQQDMSPKVLIVGIIVTVLFLIFNPFVPVGVGGSSLVVVFGILFAAVSSRIVGIVGSSNNPVSGMTIAALLISTILIAASGITGAEGMKLAIAVGTIVAIILAISGDASQDLKTGYLVGSTPVKQQYGEIIGVVAAALAIAFILNLLDAAYGFGTEQLGAPQAMLMKTVIESVMGGELPWSLVFVGAALAFVVACLDVPALAFAIGVYLPVPMSACILVGGLIRWYFERRKYKSGESKEDTLNRGMLFCSGMIAGEGIIGIVLAIFAVLGIADVIDVSSYLPYGDDVSNILGLVTLLILVAIVVKFTKGKSNN